jgi:hypothetical protein
MKKPDIKLKKNCPVIRIGIITDARTPMIKSLPNFFAKMLEAYGLPWGALHIVFAKSDPHYKELYEMFQTKQVAGMYQPEFHSEVSGYSHIDVVYLKTKNLDVYRKHVKGRGFYKIQRVHDLYSE